MRNVPFSSFHAGATANPIMNHSRPQDAKRLFVEVSVDFRIPAERVMDMLLGEAFKAVRRPGLRLC